MPHLSPERFVSALSQGLAPYYFFYGSETALREHHLVLLQTALHKTHKRVIVSPSDLENVSSQRSLFSEPQAFELRLPPKISSETHSLLNQFFQKKPLDESVLVILAEGCTSKDKMHAWFREITHKGIVVAHWPMTGKVFSRWLFSHARALGKTLDTTACEGLTERYEGNCLGALQALSLSDHDATAPDTRYTLLDFYDAFITGARLRLLKILEAFRENDASELPLLLWALAKTARVVIQCHYAPASVRALLQQHSIPIALQPAYQAIAQQSDISPWIRFLQSLSLIDRSFKSAPTQEQAWQQLIGLCLRGPKREGILGNFQSLR